MISADQVSIVIPTVGRPSLKVLLDSIVAAVERANVQTPRIVLVDDRPGPTPELAVGPLPARALLRHSGGRGPAAARNVGWRACGTEWIAFLDDDVVVSQEWLVDLLEDLDRPAPVGGSKGTIAVPLPVNRRPTDWERGTAGLETAAWITADMAYRRTALVRSGGFDERFPRAFREDSDLALRVMDLGFELVHGKRRTTHPVRPAPWWASLKQQRGNADDVLMRRLHGAHWRQRAQAPLGRRPQHVLATALGVAAVLASAAGKRRLAGTTAAAWALSTVEFCWRRLRPGPRDGEEVLKMLTTSIVIPPAATWFWLRGLRRHRAAGPLRRL